jgi:hypothetical protein
MPDGCKVYVDSYMASNGSCFMVTWIIFNNHLLEVGLTQNWETMHFEHSQPFIYYISPFHSHIGLVPHPHPIDHSGRQHLIRHMITVSTTFKPKKETFLEA